MPYNFDFEGIKFTGGELKADIKDYDGDSNAVIEKGQPATITVDWWLKTTDPWLLDGTKWMVQVSAESIGPGPEMLLAAKEVPIGPGPYPEPNKVVWHLGIPLDTKLPEDGVYKLVVVLTHMAKFADGSWRKTRLAGFAEIPMVQFYTHET